MGKSILFAIYPCVKEREEKAKKKAKKCLIVNHKQILRMQREIYFFRKIKKNIKIGKKGLTNDKKHAKIVNCIIIAHTALFMTECDKLPLGNLHKKEGKVMKMRGGT